MSFKLEDVFRTEGVPEFTFVRPPNFHEILVDIRNPGKPVIIEGQSGTGKTTTVKKIIEDNLPAGKFVYLSARKAADIPRIMKISAGEESGSFILDDFHRLSDEDQRKIADIIKVAAEEFGDQRHPKLVIIGINKVGSELIHLVHDIAKRCGIHRIKPASFEITSELIQKGEKKLQIVFFDHKKVFIESKGDYWLTQLVCQSICIMSGITESVSEQRSLDFNEGELRQRVIERLEHSYEETVKEFCRGKRFRSTNDPYLRLLKCISQQESSIVDLTELANSNEDARGSINNIKEVRLGVLIESKPICERYFYYNAETKLFAIEDPALFYYLKHLNWDDLRKLCGFRQGAKNYEWDFAVSFAGENRDLARMIADQLELMDCSVFFDEYYEANYLGKAWHKKFGEIFGNDCRFIVCLLDRCYLEKIWPTFERECFLPRVSDGAVIPIYLDNTAVPGIPRDIVGITFNPLMDEGLPNRVTDEIVFKLLARIEEE